MRSFRGIFGESGGMARGVGGSTSRTTGGITGTGGKNVTRVYKNMDETIRAARKASGGKFPKYTTKD